MWRLFCHFLSLISPFLGASGRFCFLILAFLVNSIVFFVSKYIFINTCFLKCARLLQNTYLYKITRHQRWVAMR